jgi:hypothetical protein
MAANRHSRKLGTISLTSEGQLYNAETSAWVSDYLKAYGSPHRGARGCTGSSLRRKH